MKVIFEKNVYLLTEKCIYKNGIGKRFLKNSQRAIRLAGIVKTNNHERALLFVKFLEQKTSFPDKDFKCLVCKKYINTNRLVCKEHKRFFNRYRYDYSSKKWVLSIKLQQITIDHRAFEVTNIANKS